MAAFLCHAVILPNFREIVQKAERRIAGFAGTVCRNHTYNLIHRASASLFAQPIRPAYLLAHLPAASQPIRAALPAIAVFRRLR
jgi:hypothetical protein